MRLIRPMVALATATLLLIPPTSAGGQPAREGPRGTPARPSTATVTLITGDRVLVESTPGQPDRVGFRGGGSATGAVTSRTDKHTYVIPTGVLSEVTRGRLDRALFDVKTLIAEGYDDSRSKTLPVIVEYAGSPAIARSRASKDSYAGVTTTRLLSSIGAKAVKVAKGPGFWRSVQPDARAAGIERIRLDRRVRTALDQSVAQIGAPASWQRGYTGKGVKVAVLDTGIDTSHLDLTGKIAAEANFSESPDTVDRLGHGTHVAGTIAGSGAASQGKYRGVAPDATLLNGKVLDDDGFGTESGVIAGMEWATAQGAKVVNISLGGGTSDGTDPVAQAVNALTRQTGALFVVAAGNCFGPTPEAISSPASADLALAVASLERDGAVSDFSCRGPRYKDRSLKPEIAAPGSGIVAARAAGTEPEEPVGEHYAAMSGTSMATPHVAGTAALLAERHSDWTGEQLRNQLISTADPQTGGVVADQGAGRVDADQVTDTALTVDTGELEFGSFSWPRPNPAPVTKKVVYRNAGNAPVTLNVQARPDKGEPTVRLSTNQLVLPAGGEASLDVTSAFDSESGLHTGRVVATPAGGGDPLVTSYGWYLEPEMYDLTIIGINVDGSGPDSLLNLTRRGGGFTDWIFFYGGRHTVRVPPGSYALSGAFYLPATDTTPDTGAVVAEPQFTVSSDRTITLDARKAKPVRVSVEGQPGLRTHSVDMDLPHKQPNGEWFGRTGFSAVGEFWRMLATPTGPVPADEHLRFVAGARLQIPPYRARSADGTELPVSDVWFGPRFTGTKKLVPIDAGAAAPEDLAGDRVKGKLAVVRRIVDAEAQQALAAEQAGAAAVVFHDPDRPGLVRAEFPLGPDARIPVLATDRVTASRVLTQNRTVRITGVASSPFVYHAAEFWSGRVPADPTVRKRQAEFATVVEDFGAHGDASAMFEDRFGTLPDGKFGDTGGTWLHILDRVPRRRISYLVGSVAWMHWVGVTDPDFQMPQTARWFDAPRVYRAGEVARERWFAPVALSGLPRQLPEEIHGQSQVGLDPEGASRGTLVVAIAPFAHGASETEEWPYTLFGIDGTYEVVVRRNGAEIGRDARPASWYFNVPADAADYQITMDAQRERSWWQYSTQVKSSWWFRSKGGKSELMPLIVADVDIPSADLRNQVKVGQPTRIDLTLRHQARTSTARFTKAKLEISYDGKTWTELSLRPTSADRYSATVTHPAAQAGNAVQLRLDATDENGARLTQEVTRAHGLTK